MYRIFISEAMIRTCLQSFRWMCQSLARNEMASRHVTLLLPPLSPSC